MKKMILIISILSLLIMGCSEDDAPTTSTTDYTEFLDELEQEIPPCYHDCGITSPTSLCTLILDDTDTCMDDCTGDDQPDEEFIEMCAVCIAADNCDEVMLDDDDDSDGDSDDDSDGDSDGDPPECVIDCPDFQTLLAFFEEGESNLTSDGVCGIFATWDNGCLNDCGPDDLGETMVMVEACIACLEADNCEEMFQDE